MLCRLDFGLDLPPTPPFFFLVLSQVKLYSSISSVHIRILIEKAANISDEDGNREADKYRKR